MAFLVISDWAYWESHTSPRWSDQIDSWLVHTRSLACFGTIYWTSFRGCHRTWEVAWYVECIKIEENLVLSKQNFLLSAEQELFNFGQECGRLTADLLKVLSGQYSQGNHGLRERMLGPNRICIWSFCKSLLSETLTLLQNCNDLSIRVSDFDNAFQDEEHVLGDFPSRVDVLLRRINK